jgi:hypothetical protein
VKVEENKETPNLLSLSIRFVCEISHAGVNYSTNPAVNLAGVLYFEVLFKKLYLLYVETEGVCNIIAITPNLTMKVSITSRLMQFEVDILVLT